VTDAGALPAVVSRYQDAHDRHETAAARSVFAPDARVVDAGYEFRGSDEIGDRLVHASRESRSRVPTSAPRRPARTRWLVVNHLDGNFPGSVVDLHDEFVRRADLISQLVIAP